ncbi:cell division protein ZipA [Xylella fastidiosa]|uniref:cell division protein ZipA n=1 Tax=Xylella fastidiosa TaxID=2371 RepID=UPI000707AABF|nr:cell division protein ZipA [Xylella fastidiosa]KQH74842.1 cell division protein ZipA [Xylella fastidiosa]MDD0928692.1 cell division protein ZipA [Xylella fastidiosa subsp. multiplex]QTX27821.1 cell division protein ZipA [Xylella fastidiosa subsp. multiplex]RWA45481.1 cell division protein ZipA [Xylella fastidiosa subsp. sandyi]TNV90964.1 cell division protein ZipA [Xylella fastidiosa]
MSDVTLLRIGIAIVGILFVAAVFFFSTPKTSAHRVRTKKEEPPRERREPMLSTEADNSPHQSVDEVPASVPQQQVNPEATKPGEIELGKRPTNHFDKIILLFVAAKAEHTLRGEDIVVAAEKTGMIFGYMNVFHRLVEGYPERGPIFSMASILKPGSFDMANIREMQIPAISFFLTLPAPMTALDAWEKMLPTVQRMAELLDGVVLDESRNALGRQRIAHIRDELRAYDRQQQVPPLIKNSRW